MTIEEVRCKVEHGSVYTVDEFMGKVDRGSILPCDGVGVFVFKRDKSIPGFWDNRRRAVWSVLKGVRVKADGVNGDVKGWRFRDGELVPLYSKYRTVGYKLSDRLVKKIECVCWYNN